MSLVNQLSRGELGVRFSILEAFVVESDTGDSLTAVSEASGAAIWVFYSKAPLDLNPAHSSILRQDLERAARDIFIMTSTKTARDRPLESLRTDDPSWSPLVEVTPLSLSGGAALSILHRMRYEPGNEWIMGHLLIPVWDGMIEVRTLNVSRQTGYRETIAMGLKMKESPPQPEGYTIAQLQELAAQIDYDNPALDEKFPEHPLSLARQLLRTLQERLVVVNPPKTPPAEIISASWRCAFTPPPRYHLSEDNGSRIQLVKMSIATTDGCSILTVVCIGELQPSLASGLEDLVQKASGGMPPKGSTEVKCTVRTVLGPDQRSSAEGHLTFVRADGFLGQTAIRAFEDIEKSVWLLTLGTGQSSPTAELFRELDGVVTSFRCLTKPPTKPWYQFWKS
jgi:hypothetical protein